MDGFTKELRSRFYQDETAFSAPDGGHGAHSDGAQAWLATGDAMHNQTADAHQKAADAHGKAADSAEDAGRPGQAAVHKQQQDQHLKLAKKADS